MLHSTSTQKLDQILAPKRFLWSRRYRDDVLLVCAALQIYTFSPKHAPNHHTAVMVRTTEPLQE
ncbi:MAG: hypothetical protein MUF71_04445 [Candidatus Kapabacteria bacterium]|nr:hypothetical protein [Candidatus Kapabacteria bacterium]